MRVVTRASFGLSVSLSLLGCQGLVLDAGPGGGGEVVAPPPLRCAGGAALPSSAPLRRLTNREYENTVRDLFRGATLPDVPFPPPARVDGFENNALSLPATSILIENEHDGALAIATVAARDRSSWMSCEDAACLVGPWLDEFLTRAYRRPPSTEELDRARAFVDGAPDLESAVRDLVQVVLMSPQFLYRVEETPAGSSGVVALDDYQIASRLSYFLWQTMPDDALFESAASGALRDSAGVEGEARRMLDDPRARETVADFHRQWLELDQLDMLTLDSREFPELTADLRSSFRASLEAYVDWAFWEGGSIDALFSSDRVFVDEELAPLLDVEAGAEMTPVSAPNRRGLLTQPGLLASTSHGTTHSPIFRGVMVLRKFLCFALPPAPPGVNTSVEPIPEGVVRTTREHFEMTHSQPECASCHAAIDQAGFTLENYDALGRFVTEENGAAIDSRGSLPIGDGVQVSGGEELADVLAESTEVRSCLTQHWYRFAFGRAPATEGDACEIASITSTVAAMGDDPRELLIALATSRTFRERPVAE